MNIYVFVSSFAFLFLCNSMHVSNQYSHRRLESPDTEMKQVYLVTGNFSLDGEMLNFAQYDVSTNSWTKKYEVELFSVDSHGVILDVVANQSTSCLTEKLYIAGTFDTVTSTSQIQFCSVGSWNGQAFEKVGEGLCPRGISTGTSTMKMMSIILGNNGDLFVGGNFESRMWNGKNFEYIQNIAKFSGSTSSWFPLSREFFTCNEAARLPSVQVLAWDASDEILYIGGEFDSLDYQPHTVGISTWSEKHGIHPFPTKGAYVDTTQQGSGTIYNMQFEDSTKSLFVAGNFRSIGNIYCQSVAVWHRPSNSWTCLYDTNRAVSTVTTLLLHGKQLFVAGWAAPSADWSGRKWGLNYAVAVLNIAGYLSEKSQWTPSNISANYIQRKTTSMYHGYNHVPRRTSNVSGRFVRSASPTLAPTKPYVPKPWIPVWRWLDNFPGGNGPIVKLVAGRCNLIGCLFIVGAFNNDQAVLIWCNTTSGPSLTTISPNHTIQGLVTSITQFSVVGYVIQPTSAPVEGPVVIINRNHAVLLVVSFALIIGALISLIVFRQGKGYQRLNRSDEEEGSRSADNSLYQSKGPFDGSTIPLTTLSGGIDNSVDFRSSFERAMHARHLPTHESLLIIDPKEVVLSKAIGEGSFGRVWSGYWRNNAVAIKEFIFAQSAVVGGSVDRDNIIDEIVGEAGIMACLRHPKILQIYGCSLTMQAIWIVSELCNRGSLRMVLNDKSVNLTWLMKLSVCVDIADGMLYLHTRNPPIIHRDLKSHNIFVIETSPGHLIAKIGDWGSARAIALSNAKSMTLGVGTACWLAPEVISHAHFSKDSDVYAFGILLWEVYTRQEVHEHLSAAQIISKVAHEGLRPPIPKNCEWAELMTLCWNLNPKLRPGFHKILTELSAMYSSTKANARIQQMVNAKVLKPIDANNPGYKMKTSKDKNTLSSSSSMHTVPLLHPILSHENDVVFAADSRINVESIRRQSNSTPILTSSAANTPIISPYNYHSMKKLSNLNEIELTHPNAILHDKKDITVQSRQDVKPVNEESATVRGNTNKNTDKLNEVADSNQSMVVSPSSSQKRSLATISSNWVSADDGGYDTT